ncbi:MULTISPECIES: hypothetical protein [Fischerella]|uniref:hypothetical protein n=1 Tax=Fischerella TaxID=1190 RepID=UPI0002D9C240|nr:MULTISPECIES: hypothetical protein [Fischerella]MBD2432909.1 hypothetical protein [Fischerella sp. FACHB-380]
MFLASVPINNQPYPYLKPLRVYGFASPPTLTLSHYPALSRYASTRLRVYVTGTAFLGAGLTTNNQLSTNDH